MEFGFFPIWRQRPHMENAMGTTCGDCVTRWGCGTSGMRWRRLRGDWRLCVVLIVASVSVSSAEPPEEPLPAPEYSFDVASPSVFFFGLRADSILQLDWPIPATHTDPEVLGLGDSGDDLDALSSSNAGLSPEVLFSLLFSVDPQSPGAALPDEEMIEEGVPYNVSDQAARGHQSGDQYMSLPLFTKAGLQEAEEFNNVLVRNNYDEGGTDFSALPAGSAEDNMPGANQDRVDATAFLDSGGVYFSATADSPSLNNEFWQAVPSGANIIYCAAGAHLPSLYAQFDALGLQQEDDLDALIVFDTNVDGLFDGSDLVLFSLAPESPSLALIPEASPAGAAADVFAVAPGQAPWVFASAQVLGLGDPGDNIDALELLICDDAEHCAEDHGIQHGGEEESEEDEPEDDEPEEEPEVNVTPRGVRLGRAK